MGMGYKIPFDQIAVSAIQDLLEIVAPADACVIVKSFFMGQSTDAGDAQAEMLPIQFIKGFTTSGSGGATVTPSKNESGFAAAGLTAERNNTTVANTGTTETLVADAFNVQVGYQWQPTPEERITLSPSQRLVIKLPVAPADPITCSGYAEVEEIGG